MHYLHSLAVGVFLFFSSVIAGTVGYFHLFQHFAASQDQTTATTTQVASSLPSSTTVQATASPSSAAQELADCPFGTRLRDQEGNIAPVIIIGTHVYNSSCYPFIGADPATFVALDDNYSKDKTHVWYDGSPAANMLLAPKQIQGADPATFTLIPDPYGAEGYTAVFTKDKNHVYNYSLILEGANPATFTPTFYPNGFVNSNL